MLAQPKMGCNTARMDQNVWTHTKTTQMQGLQWIDILVASARALVSQCRTEVAEQLWLEGFRRFQWLRAWPGSWPANGGQGNQPLAGHPGHVSQIRSTYTLMVWQKSHAAHDHLQYTTITKTFKTCTTHELLAESDIPPWWLNKLTHSHTVKQNGPAEPFKNITLFWDANLSRVVMDYPKNIKVKLPFKVAFKSPSTLRNIINPPTLYSHHEP